MRAARGGCGAKRSQKKRAEAPAFVVSLICEPCALISAVHFSTSTPRQKAIWFLMLRAAGLGLG